MAKFKLDGGQAHLREQSLFDDESEEPPCIHVRAVPRWRMDGSYGVDCTCGASWPTEEEWHKTEGGALVKAYREQQRRRPRKEG